MYKVVLISALSAACAAAQNTAAVEDGGPMLQVQVAGPANVAFDGISGPFVVDLSTSGALAVTKNSGPLTGAPYSAQATTERVQVLGDGNRIEETTSSSFARDSEGRTRIERTLPGATSDGGQAPQLITIEDPVGGFNYTLDTLNKIAFRMPALTHASELSVKTAGKPLKVMGKEGTMSASVSDTDLGSQTMEGVTVQGRRITRTIPAGSIGNQQPIVITTETWYSPDLKVLVMSKSNDPRIGETTYTLSNIQRTEPAASLFQVPADYTVKDQPGKGFAYQKMTTAPKE